MAYPLLGEAVLTEVIVHDLVALNPDDLPLLPRDVRDALEFALRTMPAVPPISDLPSAPEGVGIPYLQDLAHLLIAAHVTVGFGEPHPYPGCYLWVDDDGRIAYVGTSENVQARVESEQAAARRGELFPLAVGIRSHALTPLAVYVLEFSPRLAWALLVRERSFLDKDRFEHIDDALNNDPLTPRNLEELLVRSLALAYRRGRRFADHRVWVTSRQTSEF